MWSLLRAYTDHGQLYFWITVAWMNYIIVFAQGIPTRREMRSLRKALNGWQKRENFFCIAFLCVLRAERSSGEVFRTMSYFQSLPNGNDRYTRKQQAKKVYLDVIPRAGLHPQSPLLFLPEGVLPSKKKRLKGLEGCLHFLQTATVANGRSRRRRISRPA